MTTGADTLRTAFASSRGSLERSLSRITEDEFFWEPVRGCWTVHPRAESRRVPADGSGDGVIDYDPSQPQPTPFTTIAWRTVRVAGVNPDHHGAEISLLRDLYRHRSSLAALR